MQSVSSAAIHRPRRAVTVNELLPRLKQALEAGRDLRARFDCLQRVSETISQGASLGEALATTLEAIRSATGAAFGSMTLVSERGDRFTHEVLAGFEAHPDLRTVFIDRLARSVSMEGQRLFIPKTQKDSRFPELRPYFSAVRSVAMVPIGAPPKIMGVIGIASDTDGPVLADDTCDFLAVVATQLEGLVRDEGFRRSNLEIVVAVVRSLTAALEARDPYTRGHSERVAKYSLAIVHELEMAGAIECSPDFRNTVRLAAFLHDVGKIGITDAILQKPGGLTPEEFEEVKKHTLKGAQIIDGIPELAEAIPGIVSHHERPDGRGYPHGVAGDDIPLLGKVIGTADAFDAMTTDRPYKKGVTHEQGVEIVRGLSGVQFDPEMVQALASAYRSGLLEEGGLDTRLEDVRRSAHGAIEKIFSREIHDLPALPQIITQILDRTRDPKCPVREVVRLVSHDQALVIKMLRLVNSAFYGFSRKISTINLAVAILGYRVVQNVVLNIGVMGVFKKIMGANDQRRMALFEHSIECAVISKTIAAKLPQLQVQQDEAFTAGLLHDIGKIVLDQYARESQERILQLRSENGMSELEAERAVLGFDHSQIGEWIAMRWNIPLRLREAILYHHRPFASLEGAPGAYSLVKVVALADAIFYLTREDADPVATCGRLAEASLSEAGLDPETLELILESVEREKKELQQTLTLSDGG